MRVCVSRLVYSYMLLTYIALLESITFLSRIWTSCYIVKSYLPRTPAVHLLLALVQDRALARLAGVEHSVRLFSVVD